jgi:cysteine desulfurase NifS/selenium donor protein
MKKSDTPIYLDYNATTPIAPEVAEAMRPFLSEYFGNPSSSHWYGQQTKRAVESARQDVAALLGCETDEVIFTSGGSESNNLAIKGIAEAHREQGNHIITSQIEHPAVLNPCGYLEKHGYEVTYVPVDEYGTILLDDLKSAIRPTTILITIMHANNEVGTIQPIAEIADIAKAHNILFHTDAAQSAGKIAVGVKELGVSLLSLAGHKLYAPKGIGALYIKRGTRISPLIHGADHEGNLRAGTENVLEIAGLGKACAIAALELENNSEHMRLMRNRLWDGLHKRLPDLQLNGHPEHRLPNTLSVGFPRIDANTLLDELTQIAASPGAACHTDVAEPSAVLQAMKVPIEYSLGTIRFSTGRLNTESDIDKAVTHIADAVERLRGDVTTPVSITDPGEIKLTHFTHGLGCACKMRPQNLERVLASLPVTLHPDVIVGNSTSDDAAVYRINDNEAIVQTVDFFTPVVDDPYAFGSIAAANSLSDIYAMGATPLFALNIVGFPEKRLPLEVLQQILRGAFDKTKEAGIPILGGHTVEDSEPKFGLVVTGRVHPEKILKNNSAKPGDVLFLTKPIGLGIISTAIKRGLVDEATKQTAIDLMSRLNKTAAGLATTHSANACTDVTGFGLLGHLKEMTTASLVDAVIHAPSVPLIQEATSLVSANVVPGGTVANREYVSDRVTYDDDVPENLQILLCDAQTSGGLIIAIPGERKDVLQTALQNARGETAVVIGEITGKGKGNIRVTM